MKKEADERPKPKGCLTKLLIILALLGLTVFGLIVGLGVWFLAPLKEAADAYDLAEVDLRDQLGGNYVSYHQLPAHVVDALVAVEDQRFFEHDGIDYQGIARAARRNVDAGNIKEGASTITQQLAKNTFGLKERTFKRKIIEAFIAGRLEEQYSKPQIFEFYVNRIYFGGGYTGIAAAAQGYFGCSVGDLTIGDAALLSGIIKSPNRLSPYQNPTQAREARNHALRRMVAEAMITQEEAERWAAETLRLR